VHEAWQEYEPVQLAGTAEITLPAKNTVARAFHEQEKLVGKLIAHRIGD
jgi:hypothetical protein